MPNADHTDENDPQTRSDDQPPTDGSAVVAPFTSLPDATAFGNVVESRRSTRVYTDAGVPETVMRRCLELALLAPSSSNLQPWEFYWVRDPGQKRNLIEYCLGQPAAQTAAELVVCVARLDTWKRNCRLVLEALQEQDDDIPDAVFKYYRKVVPLAYGQGPLYVMGPLKRLLLKTLAIKRPMPRGPAGKADMRVWAHKSTALACQNLMLALRAHGFDSCPMEGMDEVRIRKMLRLPRRAEICMVISAGKRSPEGIYGPRLRLQKSQSVFEI